VIGIMTGLRRGCWWNRVAIGEGQEIFLFPKSRRPHMGTTQPCILWPRGETYPGSKGAMAWILPLAPGSAKVNEELYLFTLTCLSGVHKSELYPYLIACIWLAMLLLTLIVNVSTTTHGSLTLFWNLTCIFHQWEVYVLLQNCM
jgi:hypothetical protein